MNGTHFRSNLDLFVLLFFQDMQHSFRGDPDIVEHLMDGSTVLLVDPRERDLLVVGCRAAVTSAHHTRSWITSTSIAPDERTFCTAGMDGFIHIWNTQTGSLQGSLEHEDGDPVTAAKFSKDSKFVASGGQSGTIRIFSTDGTCAFLPLEETRKADVVRAEHAHSDVITSIDFAVPSRRCGCYELVTSSRDTQIKVWSLVIAAPSSVASDAARSAGATITLARTLSAHTAIVHGCCFLGGFSSIVVSCGSDRKLIVWAAPTTMDSSCSQQQQQHHQCLDRFSSSSVVSCVASSRWTPANDAVTLAAGSWDGRLEIYRFPIAFCGGSRVDHEDSIIEKSQGNLDWLLLGSIPSTSTSVKAHDEPIYSVSFTNNGAILVSSGIDRIVKVWDTSSSSHIVLLASLQGHHRDAVISNDVSCSGRIIASGSRTGSMQLWHTARGFVRCCLEGHADFINQVVFTKDGRTGATASRDRTARIWDVQSGETVAVLHGHNCNVDGVRFALDGKTLATSGADGSAMLWEVPSGRLIAAIDDA